MGEGGEVDAVVGEEEIAVQFEAHALVGAHAHVVEHGRRQVVQAHLLVDADQLQFFAGGEGMELGEPGIAVGAAGLLQDLLQKGVAMVAGRVADPRVVAEPGGADALAWNAQQEVAALVALEGEHRAGEGAGNAQLDGFGQVAVENVLVDLVLG